MHNPCARLPLPPWFNAKAAQMRFAFKQPSWEECPGGQPAIARYVCAGIGATFFRGHTPKTTIVLCAPPCSQNAQLRRRCSDQTARPKTALQKHTQRS